MQWPLFRARAAAAYGQGPRKRAALIRRQRPEGHLGPGASSPPVVLTACGAVPPFFYVKPRRQGPNAIPVSRKTTVEPMGLLDVQAVLEPFAPSPRETGG